MVLAQQDYSATFCLLLLISAGFVSTSSALEISPEFQNETAPKVALSLGILLVVSFGLYVVYYRRKSILLERAAATRETNAIANGIGKTSVGGEVDYGVSYESENKFSGNTSLEEFLTARHSISWRTIGWSLYASAVGSGAVVAPAEFGYWGGALGVFAYAIATALPLLMIAYFGPMIHKAFPKLLSLSDFILFRFGPKTQVMVVLITILNMAAAAIAEYTTLASLYSDFIGLKDYAVFFVLLVGVVTLSYTAYGGLKASIITDRVQAMTSVFLIQVVVIFLVADFSPRELLDSYNEGLTSNETLSKFAFTNDMKGFNKSGYSSLFTLPLSLITATIFSEAMWQRSWAAADDKALKKGAMLGFTLVFILVSFFGILGIMVSYTQLVTYDDIDNGFNSNLFTFQVFTLERGHAVVSSGIGVLVLLLATTLAEGAIDSLQNGIEASISGAIFRFFDEKTNLRLARLLLVIVNIPFIIIGLQKFSILSVFVFANMVCVCAFFPIVLGFYKSPLLRRLLNDWIPPASFLITIVLTIIFAAKRQGGIGAGLKFAFWENTLYEYEYFLFALLVSIGVTLLLLAVVHLLGGSNNDKEWGDSDVLDTKKGNDMVDPDKTQTEDVQEIAAPSV